MNSDFEVALTILDVVSPKIPKPMHPTPIEISPSGGPHAERDSEFPSVTSRGFRSTQGSQPGKNGVPDLAITCRRRMHSVVLPDDLQFRMGIR